MIDAYKRCREYLDAGDFAGAAGADDGGDCRGVAESGGVWISG